MIQIRNATSHDIPAIRNIAYAVWPPTYGPILPPGQVEYMLEMMYSIPALEQQMTQAHQFFLAEENGTPLGFASCGITDPGSLKLHKLYVMNNTQGKGIGATLLSHVCGHGRLLNAGMLYLNVNKQNAAYHFYLKQGFRVLREEVINIGNGYVMDDYILKLDL